MTVTTVPSALICYVSELSVYQDADVGPCHRAAALLQVLARVAATVVATGCSIPLP